MMKHRPAESDQLMIVMEDCVPMISRKLRDLGIRNFEELHRFGVQKESDLAQDKKYFRGRTSGRDETRSSSMISPSHNLLINEINKPHKFSNLGRPLSKVLEKLVPNTSFTPKTTIPKC